MNLQTNKNQRSRFLGVNVMLMIGAFLVAPLAQAASVSNWSFNENVGSVAKDTISSNNAILTNGPTWVLGKSGSAIKFDGSNDYLKVPTSSTINNIKGMDLTLWISPSSLGERSQGWLVSKAKGGGGLPTDGWALRLNNSPVNSLVFVVDHANSHLEVVTAKNSVTLNQWNKVRVTWTGSNIASNVKIYVNDKEVTYSEKINGAGSRSLDASSPLLIGADPSKKRSFAGVIDEVVLNDSILNISTTTTSPIVVPPPVATTTPIIVVPPTMGVSVFKVNDRVQTTASINVREVAGLNGKTLGTQATSAIGTILSATPVISGGYIWVPVNFDSGVDGWVADSFLKLYVTVPPIATTTPPIIIIPPATTATGIWKPKPFTTWQWQLTGTIDTTVSADMFDIDLYDASQATIATLQKKGSKVICYFSAGSYEDWRSDAKSFPTSVLGSNNGWPGEKWLDIRNITALAPIMGARLDLAVQKGCDGVEPDNIDGYTNSTGFPLTAANQIAYNKWLAEAAHARGLSIGLKNDIDQVVQLEPYFDWALNEQCHQYKECDTLLPFIKKGKAVFITEYSLNTTAFCPSANANGFMAMKKKLDLDASREVCWPTVLGASTDKDLIEVNSSLRIRSASGLGGQITGMATKGLTGTILQGPVKTDGYNWYKIKFANGVTGWSSDVGFNVK